LTKEVAEVRQYTTARNPVELPGHYNQIRMKSQSAGAHTSRAVEFQERLNYIVPEPETGTDVDDLMIGNESHQQDTRGSKTSPCCSSPPEDGALCRAMDAD
jgi:hypothetical protein